MRKEEFGMRREEFFNEEGGIWNEEGGIFNEEGGGRNYFFYLRLARKNDCISSAHSSALTPGHTSARGWNGVQPGRTMVE